MLAWLGLLLLLLSAWCYGRAIVPSSWFGKREERAILSVATGLAFLSYAVLGIGLLGLLYPATVLALLLAPLLTFAVRLIRKNEGVKFSRHEPSKATKNQRRILWITLGTAVILCSSTSSKHSTSICVRTPIT